MALFQENAATSPNADEISATIVPMKTVVEAAACALAAACAFNTRSIAAESITLRGSIAPTGMLMCR
jgi:hypothetical protein